MKMLDRIGSVKGYALKDKSIAVYTYIIQGETRRTFRLDVKSQSVNTTSAMTYIDYCSLRRHSSSPLPSSRHFSWRWFKPRTYSKQNNDEQV